MKTKIGKGQYGYRDASRRTRLIITAVLAAAIVAQVVARQMSQNQAARNILTVMAILTVLPMANMASPLLAAWRYRTPSRAFYEKVQPYEAKTAILYDLILTTKEYVLPVDAIAVHPAGIYAYLTTNRADTAKAEQSLGTLFSANRLDPKIKLFTDEKSFFRRLDSLKPADTYEDDGTVEASVLLLKSLSM